MIYVCVTTRNQAATIGLLLWKIRQVFAEDQREYQLVVLDDGSTDDTASVLERYGPSLPLTTLHRDQPQGYAAGVEELLRFSVARSDRPKRDCAVTLRGGFDVSPNVLPELIRRFESGADVVVGEGVELANKGLGRLVRRAAPYLLRPGVNLPGIQDPLSGVFLTRLVTVERALRDRDGNLLESEGISARAELLARVAAHARQVISVPLGPANIRSNSGEEERSLELALDLFRTGRRLHVPAPEVPIQRTT